MSATLPPELLEQIGTLNLQLSTFPLSTEDKPRPRLFESWATLRENQAPPKYLVKRLIETPSTVLVFGPSGGGKSGVAVDLAGATATGGTWAGRDVTPGAVFYLAGEGRLGLQRRFQAWELQRAEKIPADKLFLSTMRIELNELGAEAVETQIDRTVDEFGAPPALIIIDTLARALPAGADENSAKDMGAFVNICDRIRDRFDCVVVIIHHAGVADDKRARGSTSLKAAMDSELCITRRGVTRLAEWTKLKDLPEEPHPQEFALEPVLLGQDDDGELITSFAVAWRGQATVKSSITTTKAESLGLDTLRATIADGDRTTLGEWRTSFYAKHWGDNDDAKQKAFRRVRETLYGKGFINIDGDYYSLTGKRT